MADQDDDFAEVFPCFIERWTERRYNQIWADVRGFVFPILEAILGKKR